MFLLELARLGAPYVLGSQSTKARIADVLFGLEPQILLVDEIDRIGTKDIIILLSLTETGIVSETKHGNRLEFGFAHIFLFLQSVYSLASFGIGW